MYRVIPPPPLAVSPIFCGVGLKVTLEDETRYDEASELIPKLAAFDTVCLRVYSEEPPPPLLTL
jgi:hypothetical protein